MVDSFSADRYSATSAGDKLAGYASLTFVGITSKSKPIPRSSSLRRGDLEARYILFLTNISVVIFPR